MTEWEEIAEKLGLDVAVVKATAGRHALITEKDALSICTCLYGLADLTLRKIRFYRI